MEEFIDYRGVRWRRHPDPRYDYAVSELGELGNQAMLKPWLNIGGYLEVNLSRKGGWDRRSVHSIVLETFVGPRPSPEHQARHLNGVKTDCRLANLCWGTAKENYEDRIRHGTDVASWWRRRREERSVKPTSDDE